MSVNLAGVLWRNLAVFLFLYFSLLFVVAIGGSVRCDAGPVCREATNSRLL